jgi:hypothetical protein
MLRGDSPVALKKHLQPKPDMTNNVTKVTGIGRFAFGSLIEPGKNLNGFPEWQCMLELDMKASEPLLNIVAEYIDIGYKQFGDGWPKAQESLNVPYKGATKPNPSGEGRIPDPEHLLWKICRKGKVRRNGAEVDNTPPRIISGTGKVLRPEQIPNIGFGSTGVAIFHPTVYSYAGQHGVKFRLVGFQIAELKEGGALPDMAPIEGGWAPESDGDAAVDLAALVGAAS